MAVLRPGQEHSRQHCDQPLALRRWLDFPRAEVGQVRIKQGTGHKSYG